VSSVRGLGGPARRRLLGWLLGVLIALVQATAAGGLVEEVGDFVQEVERLRDLSFSSDSGLYVPPTPTDLDDFAALARSLALGDLATADLEAAALGYELVRFVDITSGESFHGLREELVAGAQTRGWGSYFLRLGAARPLLVEVPHARFDTRSWEIGATVFRDAVATGLLMNGAHRNANGTGTADVAHLPTSVFQEVHTAWSGAAGERAAWQVHGFAIDNHPSFPLGTDAVLSNGDGAVSLDVVRLDTELDGLGFLSHAFNTLAPADPLNQAVNGPTPGITFSGLGATTNVQGTHSRSLGAPFVHVELERSIRFDATQRGIAADAMVAAIQAPEPAAWLCSSVMLAAAALCARAQRQKRPSDSSISKEAAFWYARRASVQGRVP
jgi:hypothetical protein